MDTWGIILIVIGAVIYLVGKKRSRNWGESGAFILGIGVGLLIAAFMLLNVLRGL